MERMQVVDTPTPHEMLVVFKQEDGLLVNVTIANPELNQRLKETPTHLVNPARAPLEEELFTAAEKQHTDDLAKREEQIAEEARIQAANEEAAAEELAEMTATTRRRGGR